MGRLGPGACKRKRAIGNGVRLAAWLATMILAAGHSLTYTCYTGCRPPGENKLARRERPGAVTSVVWGSVGRAG